MDLQRYRMEETTRVFLNDPNGDPLIDPETKERLYIDIMGAHTEEVRKRESKIANARVRQRARDNTLLQDEALDWLHEQALEGLVAATVDWGYIGLDKMTLECNEENVRKIYKEFPFILRQVDEAFKKETAYMGKLYETS